MVSAAKVQPWTDHVIEREPTVVVRVRRDGWVKFEVHRSITLGTDSYPRRDWKSLPEDTTRDLNDAEPEMAGHITWEGTIRCDDWPEIHGSRGIDDVTIWLKCMRDIARPLFSHVDADY